jgi:hypothetical protein
LRGLRFAPKQQRRIVVRIDDQSDAAPFKKPAFAGDKVHDRMYDTLIVAWPDPEITEMKPEFMPAGGERGGDRDGIALVGRLFDEANDLVVVDGDKT